jgi:hypothetical protein
MHFFLSFIQCLRRPMVTAVDDRRVAITRSAITNFSAAALALGHLALGSRTDVDQSGHRQSFILSVLESARLLFRVGKLMSTLTVNPSTAVRQTRGSWRASIARAVHVCHSVQAVPASHRNGERAGGGAASMSAGACVGAYRRRTASPTTPLFSLHRPDQCRTLRIAEWCQDGRLTAAATVGIVRSGSPVDSVRGIDGVEYPSRPLTVTGPYS